MQAMLKKLKEKNQEDGGFTLIELLVVIVIIGILAGVVVFAVNGIITRGEKSACSADERTLTVAQEANYARDEKYVTEAVLVSNGFLQSESELWNTAPNGTGSDYTLSAQPQPGGDLCVATIPP